MLAPRPASAPEKSVQVTAWRPPFARGGLEVVRIENDEGIWVSHLTQYNIGIVDAGAFDFWYRRRTWSLGQGPVKLSEPGEVHRDLRVHAPVTMQILEVSPALMAEAARTLELPAIPHFGSVLTRGDGTMELAVRRLHALLAMPEPDPFECETRFAGVLELLLTEYGERSPNRAPGASNRRAARRARDYLHATFTESIGLDVLASEVGLNKFHLLRLFRTEYGLPPHEYVTHLRIARARELLAAGVPAGTVAAEVGLCDQSHLNRLFARIARFSPGRYAKAMRGGRSSGQ